MEVSLLGAAVCSLFCSRFYSMQHSSWCIVFLRGCLFSLLTENIDFSGCRSLEVKLQNEGVMCYLFCLFVLSDLYDGFFLLLLLVYGWSVCYCWGFYVFALMWPLVKLVSQVSMVNCNIKDRYFDKMQKLVRFLTRNLVQVFSDLSVKLT